MLHFKKSAAVAATHDLNLKLISHANAGLIQVIVDNFDVDIHSQNGKFSTHPLALLVTQRGSEQSEQEFVVNRIKK